MALTRPKTRQLVDNDFKSSCRVATTANVTLAGGAPSTVDGISLVVSDRILVKNQSTASQNGIYKVTVVGTGANGTWVRAEDFNLSILVSSGNQVNIEQGTLGADTSYLLATDGPIVLGTTALSFVSAGGVIAQTVSTAAQPNITSVGTLTILNVDNLQLDLNSLISTNANGNINLTPNGTGNVIVSPATASRVFYSGASKELTTSGNLTFDGTNLRLTGNFFATTKSFLIPHPLKEDAFLRYGNLEGPENGIYIRGRSKNLVIELPDYWEKLIDENSITVNITPCGLNLKIAIQRIENNKIFLDANSDIIDYFYIVFAERKDVEKLIVEYDNKL